MWWKLEVLLRVLCFASYYFDVALRLRWSKVNNKVGSVVVELLKSCFCLLFVGRRNFLSMFALFEYVSVDVLGD